ncbi:unnamed protein product, partial [Closterium sp. NIES-54]
DRTGEPCGGPHATLRCFGRLTDAWRIQFPHATEIPRWGDLLMSGVAIFDLDYDAILAAMYVVSTSAEGDCYLYVPPDPGIEAAALGACDSAATGAGESALSGTASAQVAASGQVFAAASRFGPESAPCSCRLLSHQTLLWHHRLGHPSVPRLRGMASRILVSGLPRSLPPLPPGPAPTCVKGRQHPAPHSSEFPPTKAPLQTLHMDVWVPPRVRGQGHECYFLLVVDEYSRYTTVFPLRHKGEVTEVLIDWMCAARLQLRESFGSDNPVLRLHSDRGGEFSSDLLRAFCRAEGIRQMFTLPASPQQNGIAERRIGMYAAHQINLQPRVLMPETSPTLRWTGKVGDASAFRVWGSRAFVRDLSADKLSSRAVPCVFLGFPPDAPGWQFHHPTSRRVLSSQDVTFDESLPAPSSVSKVDAVELVDVAFDSGAAGGAEPERAEPGGAGSWGAEPERAEPGGAGSGGAEPGVAECGGAEPDGAGPGAVQLELVVLPVLEFLLLLGVLEPRVPEVPSPGGTGAAGPGGATGAKAAGGAGAGGATGVGATEGTGAGAAASSGGPAGAGTAGGTGAGGAAGAGAPVGAGVGATAAAGGAAGAGGAARVGADAGGAGDVPAGSGGAARPRPYFVPLLEQLASPLPAPSPYAGPTGGLAERRELESRPASHVRAARTGRRVPRQRPPAVPGTHQMALRPSTTSQRVPLPSPPESSLPALADPKSDSLRAASPTVPRLLATVVTDPSFESTSFRSLKCPPPVQAESQLQLASPLPAPSSYAGPTGGLAERREPESRPASPVHTARTCRRVPRQRPPAVPGTHQMALRPSTAPHRVPLPSPPESSLPPLADPESDSLRAASSTDTRVLATVVTDPSFESTAASALVVELVDFAAHCCLDYAACLVTGSQSASVCPPSVGGECALSTDVLEDRQEEFQCFAAALPHLVSTLLAPEGDPDAPDIPTPRSYAEAIEGPYSSQWQSAMDAEMASWKSSGTYVDEVPPPGANIVSGMWIFRVKRPPGSPPVFKARYVARGFSQRQGGYYFQTFSPTPKMTTLRVLLHVAAQRDYELHSLDFSTAFLQGSLHEEIWLRRPPGFTRSFPAGTQWSLRRPVYGLHQVPREWHDTLRTTLAALGFAPSTADPSMFLRTITLTQSHMVQQVLQRFDFTYSSPQATLLSTRHSLSDLPSDESVEPSGPYPELVGCLMYLMTCVVPKYYSGTVIALPFNLQACSASGILWGGA